jgi:hypothetical protein
MPMLHDMVGVGAMATAMNVAQGAEALRQAGEPFDPAFIDAMIPRVGGLREGVLLMHSKYKVGR